MKYAMTFTERGRRVILGEDESVASVSADCRRAAVAFVNGLGGASDKLDVALWLTGAYARAVRHARGGERVPALASAPDVTETAVREVVLRARIEILAELSDAADHDGVLPFTDRMVQAGYLAKTVDADGVVVWVPIDAPRIRLADRVRALFAADSLDAPDVYEEMYVCGRCDQLAFDAPGKLVRLCAPHRRSSGMTYPGVVPASRDVG